MAAAARVHVAERGHSASDFTLLVMGGGGPLHGCDVARRLAINRVLCPPCAGVASALGLLIAPARVDRSATVGRTLDVLSARELEAAFAALEVAAGGGVGGPPRGGGGIGVLCFPPTRLLCHSFLHVVL